MGMGNIHKTVPSHSQQAIPIPIPIPVKLELLFPFPWDSMGPMGIPNIRSPLLKTHTFYYQQFFQTSSVGCLSDYWACTLSYLFCPGRYKWSSDSLTFTSVDVQCGPESVSAARWGDSIHTAIKPVAGETLERDAAVVRRRRYGQYSVVDAVWWTTVDRCSMQQRILIKTVFVSWYLQVLSLQSFIWRMSEFFGTRSFGIISNCCSLCTDAG